MVKVNWDNILSGVDQKIFGVYPENIKKMELHDYANEVLRKDTNENSLKKTWKE